MKKKIALVMAVVLLMVATVGGTLAWLTASTTPVVNTFTTSDINAELTETTSNYQMIPGYDISKDPKATVKGGSVDCYLFVKLDKSANYDTYLENYTIATGWTQVPNVDGVYYREVTSNTADQSFEVLSGNKVTVKTSVTKVDMTAAENNKPTLTLTVYACQLYKSAGVKMPVADAWNAVKPASSAS